jgi:hypothetical protein
MMNYQSLFTQNTEGVGNSPFISHYKRRQGFKSNVVNLTILTLLIQGRP